MAFDASSQTLLLDLSHQNLTNDTLLQHIQSQFSSLSSTTTVGIKQQQQQQPILTLNLSHNSLTSIPHFLSEWFPDVTSLDLSFNENLIINVDFFVELCHWKRLEHLFLWHLPITHDSIVLRTFKQKCNEFGVAIVTVNDSPMIFEQRNEMKQQKQQNELKKESLTIDFMEHYREEKRKLSSVTMIRNKSDVLEEIFDYYQYLMKILSFQLKNDASHSDDLNSHSYGSSSSSSSDNTSETLVSFTNFYQGLKNSLEMQLRSITRKQKYNKLIRQAKHSLFSTFYKELIACHERKGNTELAIQLQTLFMPYESVLRDCTIVDNNSGNNNDQKRKNSQAKNVTDKPNSNKMRENEKIINHESTEHNEHVESIPSEMFPVAAAYQQRIDEDRVASLIAQPSIESSKSRVRRVYEFVAQFLPFLTWIPQYFKHISHIKDDVMAGVTVGVMLIPQAMAYSLIAGLPPVYGLYTSFVPLLIYALFGSSRELAVGPSAMSSLLLASSLQQLDVGDDLNLYIMYALMFGLVGGVIQVLMGVFRLGFLVNFLSHPVLSGFTSAAAIIIASSQMGSLLGIYLPKENRLHYFIRNLINNISGVHLPTVGLACCCFCFLYLFDKFKFNFGKKHTIRLLRWKLTVPQTITLKAIPGNLALVFFGTLAVFLTKVIGHYNAPDNEIFGIKIVGTIPSGFPKPVVPQIGTWTLQKFEKVVALSFPVFIIGFMETIGIAKHFAMKNGYDVDPNQELIALGMANLVGAFFRAFPSTGSISRTAVNAGSNAKSPVSGIVSAIMVMLTLWVLTPLFYYLPMAVLASIIIYACTKIPDIHELFFTWHSKKTDTILLLLAFVSTLFVGILEGILIAAATSLVLVIWRSSRPRFQRIGRVPGTTAYVAVKYNRKTCREIPGVIVTRFDSHMYFANVSYFKDTLRKFIESSAYKVFCIVLDCSSVPQIDSTAVHTLKEIKDMLDSLDIELYFAQVKKSMSEVLERHKIMDQEHSFVLLHDAVIHSESVVSTKARLIQIENQTKAQNNPMTVVSSYYEEEEHTGSGAGYQQLV